jgi:NADH-quinone oxidoreductase subunit F
LDLHYTSAEPSPAERMAVDRALPPDGPLARHLLLPVLHSIQSHVGWISPGALNYACQRLGVPPAEAFGVADFYGMFSVQPRPPVVVHVCDDVACRARGAGALCRRLEESHGPAGNMTGSATWLRSPCLGQCERAPAALASAAGPDPAEEVIPHASADAIAQILSRKRPLQASEPNTSDVRVSVPQAGQPQLRLLRRVGRVSPESMSDYQDHGGYQALKRALAMGPEAVVREVTESKLLGRGGAAFPAGQKWRALLASRASGRTQYLVCNADESEPGTFKDRVLMENDPFAIVEAMTIAGFATGCERGFLYIRGEYPLAAERLAHAIQAARNAGLLGRNILRSGVNFDIEIRRGAGAYICGEETALFNSIEGFRGEPRNKPPFPTEKGLFGQPTLVNNVETLANVPWIILEGGDAYATLGTERSTGTRLFCVSGHIRTPGVYEVDFGCTLGQLIELAGGVGGSGKLQAVLLGGAAGAFVTPKDLDIPLTFEGVRARGATLGSGAVVLFDDTINLAEVLLRISSFFRDESCGQCVPCRVGTVRQEELLHRMNRGHFLGSRQEELVLLKEMGQAMRDASICALGQTATSAVESALAKWELFRKDSA